MATVKISELPAISHLSTNTQASLVVGVDLETGTTGKIDMTTLGEGLYAYQPLKVGENQVLFSNTIGQFSGNSATYLQINNQNFDANGSADYVASASDSDNTNKYIDMGVNGPLFSDVTYSSMKPYDGYVYVRGPTDTSTTGNLVIGTASSFANIVYIVGGTVTNNIVARMTKTDLQLSANYNLKFGDGSVQKVAASPTNYSEAAFAQANVTIGVDASQNVRLNFSNTRMDIIDGVNVSQNNRMIAIESINTIQNTAIAATDGKMQNAYIKANNALANTTGTFDGTLNIARNLTVNGTFVLANSNFTPTEAALTITASGFPPPVLPANDGYLIHMSGKQNVASRIVADSYGANTYVVYAGRSARGTITSPSAVANNDVLFRISGNGYGTTGFSPLGVGRIDIVAAQNHTDSARGSRIEMWNMPVGSNTLNQIAVFNGDSVHFTGVVNPQKGFIYTPIEYPGAQTAITIDFANNSLLRCNTSAGVTVSFTNFTAGKVVELWITNTAGTGQTFTHGCSAINSTVNSTTYNIPATSSILARYYSFDAALANTFVAIVK